MKKLLVTATTLLALSGTVLASGLSISNPTLVNFTGFDSTPNSYQNHLTINPYTSGYFGQIVASSPGTVTATYLGQESGYSNSYSLNFFGNMLTESNNMGDWVAGVVTGPAPIALNFSFNTLNQNTQQYQVIADNANAQTFNSNVPAFVVLGNYLTSQTATINGQLKTFDYILGFNDSWIKNYLGQPNGDADFDDLVIGINFTPSVVPLPAAAWLFGSALLGFVTLSNRRKV